MWLTRLKHPWVLFPLLLLVVCLSTWLWAEQVLTTAIAHGSSPNDPPWLQAHMRRQRLATKVAPLARMATGWFALLTVAGFVLVRKVERVRGAG